MSLLSFGLLKYIGSLAAEYILSNCLLSTTCVNSLISSVIQSFQDSRILISFFRHAFSSFEDNINMGVKPVNSKRDYIRRVRSRLDLISVQSLPSLISSLTSDLSINSLWGNTTYYCLGHQKEVVMRYHG